MRTEEQGAAGFFRRALALSAAHSRFNRWIQIELANPRDGQRIEWPMRRPVTR